jgi:hypothetical protein
MTDEQNPPVLVLSTSERTGDGTVNSFAEFLTTDWMTCGKGTQLILPREAPESLVHFDYSLMELRI